MARRVPHDHEYVSLVGIGLRIRVQLWRRDRRTATFAVALEYEWTPNDWRRVVCIDNFGGIVHRDRYSPGGDHASRHDPIFHSHDPDQAVNWATKHLMTEAWRYVERFRQEGE